MKKMTELYGKFVLPLDIVHTSFKNLFFTLNVTKEFERSVERRRSFSSDTLHAVILLRRLFSIVQGKTDFSLLLVLDYARCERHDENLIVSSPGSSIYFVVISIRL